MAVGVAQAAPARAAVGPALQASEGTLADSLTCPASFSGAHNPVLLVHGTTLTAQSNWSWNYGKVLPTKGYDVCAVDLPDRARADIQVSAEYVVHAIRTMAERSHRRVDVVGFSQGPLEPRWAIKYWPDIPLLVDHLVAMAGVGHGFSETEAICASDCIAPFWQMRPDSKFLAALNSGSETPGQISYTSVYSRTDQFVWLAGGSGDPWDQSARLRGASNIAIQDICPGRYVEHVQAVYDAVYFAVVMDALTHPGGADPSRIDRSVCMQTNMPGVDGAQAAAESAQIDKDLMVLTGEHHVDAEPRLATYAAG
ncbi:MAG TPA: lipase [Candidatus Dormibacteraeota bacterium]|nr:lipase [Candidatus Dormibacteraeota bacterium]